jgi:hypothetical protein
MLITKFEKSDFFYLLPKGLFSVQKNGFFYYKVLKKRFVYFIFLSDLHALCSHFNLQSVRLRSGQAFYLLMAIFDGFFREDTGNEKTSFGPKVKAFRFAVYDLLLLIVTICSGGRNR